MSHNLTLTDHSIDSLLQIFQFLEKTSGYGHSIYGVDSSGREFKVPFKKDEQLSREKLVDIFGLEPSKQLKITIVKD